MPSPPQSPPLAAYTAQQEARSSISSPKNALKASRGGAAYTITEECERLFCETLRAVFLGEGNSGFQDSLVAGVQTITKKGIHAPADSLVGTRSRPGERQMFAVQHIPSPSTSPDGFIRPHSLVEQWIEMWDYKGNAGFRGFLTEQRNERVLFIFFDQQVVGKDLKPGLMAVLELCDVQAVSCTRLVACLDRYIDPDELKGLIRDLGWVGFEPTTLVAWTASVDSLSDRWMFLAMDV